VTTPPTSPSLQKSRGAVISDRSPGRFRPLGWASTVCLHLLGVAAACYGSQPAAKSRPPRPTGRRTAAKGPATPFLKPSLHQVESTRYRAGLSPVFSGGLRQVLISEVTHAQGGVR
jgi:hypothetical protein